MAMQLFVLYRHQLPPPCLLSFFFLFFFWQLLFIFLNIYDRYTDVSVNKNVWSASLLLLLLFYFLLGHSPKVVSIWF